MASFLKNFKILTLVVMRIPLSWLKEYISLSLPPGEIAKLLTMAGLEVDGYETVGENLKDIVVGRIVEASKHPNADKLTLASVTDGKKTYQIVCGASNCRAGLKTALAPIGAVLKNGNQVFTISKTKIRGIESEGMLCSGQELGLSDDGEGIMELSNNLPEGTPLTDIYSDTYFDISLTPNLSHCTSVLGVARELAALTGQPLQHPDIHVQEVEDTIENSLYVDIQEKEFCPRYACRVVMNVKVGPSPNWVKQRLEKCGVRSVNNIVDVTNYVLLEMGHPLHAFDYEKLEGGGIVVRRAKDGELIQTLDGKERSLKDSMLVICDSQKPVAIAGVIGGLESEIRENTSHIVLESAYFDPLSIRRTSKQLGLQTDASKRFERGTDPNQLLMVLDRTVMLIQKVAGGEIQAGIIDVQSKEFPETIVTCRLSRINQVLGRMFSRGEVENVFKALQFSYQWDGQDQFIIRIPTYRVDIKAEIDLIEEVARLYGYDNIPRQGGGYLASILPSVPMYFFEKEIRTRLIAEGLQEFLTCDLIGPSLLQIVQDHSMPVETVVKVLNPTSIEQSILRTSLLPGLLQVIKYNIDHQNHNISGFEVGRIHFRDGNQYQEQAVGAIVLTGKSSSHQWDQRSRDFDFFDLKGIVENLLTELGISGAIFKNLGLETFHSGRQASIYFGDLEIGSIGEIHPAIQRRLDISQRVIFGEFNLQDLLQIKKSLEKMKPLAIYPSSERDWTLTVKNSVSFAELVGLIQKQGSVILEEVSLKDIYQSDKLSPGYHNVTLHFVYRDSSKTIEQEVVEAEHQRLIKAVLQQLGDAIKI
jgi:phenylalanyl-tRNA synthetase beta chain